MHPQCFISHGEPKEGFWTQPCGFSKCLLVGNLPSSQTDLSLTAGHSQQRPSPRTSASEPHQAALYSGWQGKAGPAATAVWLIGAAVRHIAGSSWNAEQPRMVPIGDFMGTERRVSARKTFTARIWVWCHWWKESQSTWSPVEWVRKDEKKKLKLHASPICSKRRGQPWIPQSCVEKQ